MYGGGYARMTGLRNKQEVGCKMTVRQAVDILNKMMREHNAGDIDLCAGMDIDDAQPVLHVVMEVDNLPNDKPMRNVIMITG